MRPRRDRLAAAALLLLIAAAHLGCAQQDRSGAPSGTERAAATACVCDPVPVVDPMLLAFLSKARAAHHAADLSLEAGDRAGAVRALEQIVAGPAPAGSQPEFAEVVADTRARLAELRSEGGDYDAAARDIEAGLALAPSPSHFRGHLFEVRGVVEERRAKALEAEGRRDDAARAREAATSAFEQAIAIQDQVITEALKDAKDRPR